MERLLFCRYAVAISAAMTRTANLFANSFTRGRRMASIAATASALALVLSACARNTAAFPAAQNQGAYHFHSPRYAKIQHVVIIIQENRSVDNLFQGFPGANTRSYGYDTKGETIKLHPVSLQARWDLQHGYGGFLLACDGQGSYPGTRCRMDGFDRLHWQCGTDDHPRCPNPHPPYSYVPQSETKPYFFMGEQYVFGDEMYESDFDESSFVSHQYIIAGQAGSTANYPLSLWGCGGGPDDTIVTVTQNRTIGPHIRACFNYTTLGDELDKQGLSWAYYAWSSRSGPGIWSAYQAVEHMYYGPDWSKDVISPPSQFLTDVQNGNLRSVSWVTPTCVNSDHAGCGSNTGPDWVASLVNAIGESRYWDSTVIFIFWDDPGGWYDHAPPKLVDYDGLGMRIPLLIISAYAKKGYVSHTLLEHGSILKFVENQWGLPGLSASDVRANLPRDAFDFSKPPRTFTKIPSKHGKEYFLHEPPDSRPPDEE